ncbi:NAD-dependent epimerase/dehydratase family protein [Pseudomonas sp. CG7]|uniref:GDP-mannose 4,6-dehydratase n=1 Tax=Pseudomonas sp. CG7 TaxID=191007 RepID=UPI00203492C3|nr:GDP-mannose 4,6-dehydratase [Pseudomonas sp. CG7]MCM2459275.1 NAD-dependent epimerase/dehydratase family protein [Pseudomonas sp. CG7]
MKKRLFVTGLSGFVGRHLKSRLDGHDSAWQVMPVAARYDLTDAKTLEGLWPEVPDAVIHLAGQTFVPAAFRDPARTLNINLLGTLNLLQALKARGFTGTFLYVSSGDVYGQVSEDGFPITEQQPPAPCNPYAVSKLSAELLSLQWGISEGWPVVVARPFNHIGTGQKEQFVIASAARQICRMQQGLQTPQLAVGDIDVTRDFLDVDDVVSAYLALLAKGTPGRIYNICSGREQSVRSLIEQLADIAQIEIQLTQDAARLRTISQRRVCGSHARLHQITGWKPETTTQQSLRSILSDWKIRVQQE